MSHRQFRFVWGHKTSTIWGQKELLRRCGPDLKGNPHNCMTAWEEYGPCSQKQCCVSCQGLEVGEAGNSMCTAELVERGEMRAAQGPLEESAGSQWEGVTSIYIQS